MSEPEDFPITIEVRALPQTEPPSDFLLGVYKQLNRGASRSLTLQASALMEAIAGGKADLITFVVDAIEAVYRDSCGHQP